MTSGNPSTTQTLRDAQGALAVTRILEAAVAEIEAGIEPTMRAVAARAGIAERTIYRHFPALETLQAAVMPLLRARVGWPLCESAGELPDYAEALFNNFESNRQLARTLAGSSWATPILKRSRAENRQALHRLLTAAYPDADATVLESAAASLRIPLSAAGWIYFIDAGYSQAEAVRHVRWLVETILAVLDRSRKRKPASRNKALKTRSTRRTSHEER